MESVTSTGKYARLLLVKNTAHLRVLLSFVSLAIMLSIMGCGKSESSYVQRILPDQTIHKAIFSPEQNIVPPILPTPTPLPSAPIAETLGAIDETMAALGSMWLQVSSANGPNEDRTNLVDGNPMSNWHVHFPPETKEHWILIDLGRETIVQALGVMPNVQNPKQIWDKDHAVIQGSHDKTTWSDIALLVVDRETLDKGSPQWLYYTFQNDATYRYYRILIYDDQFLSLAEIELYGKDLAPPAPVVMPTPTLPLAVVVEEIDVKIFTRAALDSGSLQVSSTNALNQDAQNLIDRNPLSHWHVKFPTETKEHWIVIDMGRETIVQALGIMPNINSPKQSWDKDHASIQGSYDKSEWSDIALLVVDRETMEKGSPQWLYYTFQNDAAYRYYRILIQDDQFLSLAEIEVYRTESLALAESVWKIDGEIFTRAALAPDSLQVSSANKADEDKQNLVDGNPQSNWHVKFPTETEVHWILIDLGKDDNLEALGIMPNVNSPNQMWDKDNASIQGSLDKTEWVDIALLAVDKERLEKDNPQWLYYTFQNSIAYRYYRILIQDDQFLSLAEIELYGK
jgi:hypothetical protein